MAIKQNKTLRRTNPLNKKRGVSRKMNDRVMCEPLSNCTQVCGVIGNIHDNPELMQPEEERG